MDTQSIACTGDTGAIAVLCECGCGNAFPLREMVARPTGASYAPVEILSLDCYNQLYPVIHSKETPGYVQCVSLSGMPLVALAATESNGEKDN